MILKTRDLELSHSILFTRFFLGRYHVYFYIQLFVTQFRNQSTRSLKSTVHQFHTLFEWFAFGMDRGSRFFVQPFSVLFPVVQNPFSIARKNWSDKYREKKIFVSYQQRTANVVPLMNVIHLIKKLRIIQIMVTITKKLCIKKIFV